MDANEPGRRKWDPLVRLTHWGIVIAILVNAIVTEEGSPPHVWVGYALAAVLGLRLLWGFIGPREARFTAFPPSPTRAIAHLREIAAGRRSDHTSHNPLGALMVYAIWGTLSVVIASGIAMAGLPDRSPFDQQNSIRATMENARPTIGEHDDEEGEGQDEHEGEEGPFGEVHEAAVNLLYLLILLHLAGVVFESRRSGRHIVMAMLPGRR